ncbi:TetR/AcrR family transcriptional regulator [soil metagenome]
MSTSALGRPVGANSEETRQRIMAATMRCVGEVGYKQATIREIARAADMTSGTLYHYFPNKSELVKATFEESAARAVPRFVQASDGQGDYLRRLVSLLDESDRLMQEYPHFAAFEQALRDASAHHLELDVTSATVFKSLWDLITEIVTTAAAAGALSPDADVDGACGVLYALIRGLTERAATSSAEEQHATLQAAKLLVRGQLFGSSTTESNTPTKRRPSRRGTTSAT